MKDMRTAEGQTFYLVGTPKGKINQHEKKWLDLPWQKVRDSVDVKLYEHEGELYVLARQLWAGCFPHFCSMPALR